MKHYWPRRPPVLCLDLDEPYDLGNTWEDIVQAMGVVQKTLYNQMESNRSTARKEWTYITDEDLDEQVAEISLAHPFTGSAIILGHLEAMGLHVQKKRVQPRFDPGQFWQHFPRTRLALTARSIRGWVEVMFKFYHLFAHRSDTRTLDRIFSADFRPSMKGEGAWTLNETHLRV
ncbi:hypothetical protein DFH09DRAFT_1105558 [Mycena vulgaris]|nr:hypothetical protein DFH09DRAFT_1105558 [Mycena vulgaris]